MITLKFPTTQADVAEQILREHDTLRHKLAKIHTVIAERNPSAAEIEALLREFLNALIAHFANEEDDGFFLNISAKAPQLAAIAGRLSVEHRALLREAEELCRFAASGSPSIAWWREFSSRCHAFDTRLMHHECEENRLLQDARLAEVEPCE